MKKLMIAVAMTIALPAAASAQAATAPAAKPAAGADCKAMHDKMMSGDHSGHQMMAGSQMDHSKMDMSKMDHSKMAANCHNMASPDAKAAPADPHAGHKQ